MYKGLYNYMEYIRGVFNDSSIHQFIYFMKDGIIDALVDLLNDGLINLRINDQLLNYG